MIAPRTIKLSVVTLLLVSSLGVYAFFFRTAIDIQFVGAVEGDEVSRWLTSSVPKTYDLDGDGMYGTHGRINFQSGQVGNLLFISGTPQYRRDDYKFIDGVKNASVRQPAGIVMNNVLFTVIGLPEHSSRVMRLGVMQNVLSSPEDAADIAKTVTVKRIPRHGETVSYSFPLGQGGVIAGNDAPDFYFLDMMNVSDRDEFLISVTVSSSGQPGYISAISLDIRKTSQGRSG